MNPISPEQYQNFRDRLSSLLQKANGLPGLLPQSAGKMEVARRKLFEDQFEITLVGEFQGGKSTTFNNLCDGREISPRGKGGGGLKTSGCIIRAQNLSDHSEKEHALVRWRTPDELVKGFDQLLSRSLARSQVTTESSTMGPDPSTGAQIEKLDLTTQAGRDRISHLARTEIAVWEEDRAQYDPKGVGLIDVIRFALLAAHFFGQPMMEKIREQQRFEIDAIQYLVTFPEDWETRWEKWRPADFNWEEVLFAFVASVDCRLHSDNLSRLGCAITDCPGLFASNWDSQVAAEALTRADAVLYLVPGDKALSLSDLQAMRQLTMGKGLILVGANCRTQAWTQTDRVLAANCQLLSRQGLGIEPANVHRYHAAMGLFARQLQRGMANLDTLTIKALRADFGLARDCDVGEIERKLVKKLRLYWENLDPNFDGEVSAQNAHAAYEQSRMPQLLDVVDRFVVERKAGTILLGNGNRVWEALGETESSLKITEENAQKQVEVRRAEFQRAEEALAGFEKIAMPLISDFGQDAPALLGASFWNQLNQKVDAFTDNLSTALAAKIKDTPVVDWIKPSKVLTSLSTQAQTQLDDWLRIEAQLWIKEIIDGHNVVYNSALEQPVKTLYRELSLHWKYVAEKQIPGLEGIIIPKREKLRPGNGITLPKSFIDTISDLLGVFNKKFLRSWGFMITLILALGVFIVFHTLSLPALALALMGIFPRLKALTSGGEEQLRKKLKENFGGLQKPIEEQVAHEVEELVRGYREGLMNEVVAHPRNIYELRKDRFEKLFELAESDRLRIAAEAKEAREQHVAPLRQECELFLADARSLFPHEQD